MKLSCFERSLSSAHGVIHFHCLIAAHVCSQYILQFLLGMAERGQFGIQSARVGRRFRELASEDWIPNSDKWSFELTLATLLTEMKWCDRVTQLKFLVTIAFGHPLCKVLEVCSPIWSPPHAMRGYYPCFTEEECQENMCLINLGQLEKRLKNQAQVGWLQVFLICRAQCLLFCWHTTLNCL